MMESPKFSTEVVHSNERIQIDPPLPGWWMNGREATHAEKLEDLQNIKQQIERHVDNVGRGAVGIVWDTATCCTHCKEPVELSCIDGVPYCCDQAQAEWVASGGVIPE